MEFGPPAATEATTALRALGLDQEVRVIHGDGYLGYPDGAPYDRLIVTCGIAGIPPRWLDQLGLGQLAPDALIIAPTTHARHVPHAGPALNQAQYHDLWCYLGTRDARITRAYPDTDAFDLTLGVCALHIPGAGTAWIHTDGSMTTTGNPEIGDHLTTLVQHWDTTGRPRVDDWTMEWRGTDPASLLLPHRWRLRL